LSRKYDILSLVVLENNPCPLFRILDAKRINCKRGSGGCKRKKKGIDKGESLSWRNEKENRGKRNLYFELKSIFFYKRVNRFPVKP